MNKLQNLVLTNRIKRSESRTPYKKIFFVSKPERKRKNLIRLGVDQNHAYSWSRTRMGGWAVAQSPILGTTITLERLRKRGYEAMLTLYEKIVPHLNEPLYTRPIQPVPYTKCRDTVVCLSRTEGREEVLPASLSGGAAYSIRQRLFFYYF